MKVFGNREYHKEIKKEIRNSNSITTSKGAMVKFRRHTVMEHDIVFIDDEENRIEFEPIEKEFFE
jgi:hypothetical protein